MKQSECHRRLEALRDAIAEYVIHGDVTRARETATDYALARDRMLTWPELLAAVRA